MNSSEVSRTYLLRLRDILEMVDAVAEMIAGMSWPVMEAVASSRSDHTRRARPFGRSPNRTSLG